VLKREEKFLTDVEVKYEVEMKDKLFGAVPNGYASQSGYLRLTSGDGSEPCREVRHDLRDCCVF
jgi:hypothetical protein